jgi:hypothetical protein
LPDRDYIGRGITRKWAAACRLYGASPNSPELEDALRKALPAELRSVGSSARSQESFDRQVDDICCAKLLGPMRKTLLSKLGVLQVADAERRILEGLAADRKYLFEQHMTGRAFRARPGRRLSPAETLAKPIYTLPKENTK